MEKTYTGLKKIKEKQGEIEFKAEIPLEVIDEYIGRVLAHAGEDVTLPGFRKGKVPLDMIRARMDEMGLLEDAADEALRAAVREIIGDEQLSIIGSPSLRSRKLPLKIPSNLQSALRFTQEIKLPDYKKIAAEITAKKTMPAEVTPEEVEAAVKHLLEMVGPEAALTDETVQKIRSVQDC